MHDDLPMDVWHRILKTSGAILPGRADSESVGRKPEQPTVDTFVAPVQAMRARRFMTTLRKQRSLVLRETPTRLPILRGRKKCPSGYENGPFGRCARSPCGRMILVLHVKSRNGVADSGMGWPVPTDEEGTHTGFYGHLATTTAPFSWISPGHAAQKNSAGAKNTQFA
jgi:hypothetical protein